MSVWTDSKITSYIHSIEPEFSKEYAQFKDEVRDAFIGRIGEDIHREIVAEKGETNLEYGDLDPLFRRCLVCGESSNISCDRCNQANYCCENHLSAAQDEHEYVCEQLQLENICRDVPFEIPKSQSFEEPNVFNQNYHDGNIPNGWKEFWREGHLPCSRDIESALRDSLKKSPDLFRIVASDMLSLPMTLIFSLQACFPHLFRNEASDEILRQKSQKFLPRWPKQLRIHVLGATDDQELRDLWKWEHVMLRLPDSITELDLTFVGPGIKTNRDTSTSVHSDLKSRGRKVVVHAVSGYYEDFVCDNIHSWCESNSITKRPFSAKPLRSISENIPNCRQRPVSANIRPHFFQKPHLLIAYNAGLHEHFDWLPTLSLICLSDLPFVATSYSEEESHYDNQLLKILRARTVLPVQSNPFASQRPLQDIYPESVFFSSSNIFAVWGSTANR